MPSDLAVVARGLGKQYRIGLAPTRYRSLGDAIASRASAPLRWLRRRRGTPDGDAADGNYTVWALRDVSFSVRQGEVLGIIGRNGAGKSTLLKLLSRVTSPTVGHADVWGRVGSLLEVGTGFHPELTGRDNVYLNGAILGMDRRYITARLEEIVEFAGIARFIDTPVKRYSSGMGLRLAFAVAAHLEPEILIIDEVLTVGDAEFQKKCIGRMDRVAREGRTVLLVSHDLTSVQRLCTRCVLLEGGHLVASGGAEEILARYLANGPDAYVPERWIDVSGVEREGTGAVAVRAVWYSSGNGGVNGLPYTFGPLEVRLKVVASVEMKVDRIQVWLSSPQGARLVVVDSLPLAGPTLLREGVNLVCFQLAGLNLNPGLYGLNCILRNRRQVIFDRLEPAFRLQVIDLRDNQPDAGAWRGVVASDASVSGVTYLGADDGEDYQPDGGGGHTPRATRYSSTDARQTS